jgi:hypothetical protein
MAAGAREKPRPRIGDRGSALNVDVCSCYAIFNPKVIFEKRVLAVLVLPLVLS